MTRDPVTHADPAEAPALRGFHKVLPDERNQDVRVYSAAFVPGTFGSSTPVGAVDGRSTGAGEAGEMTARLTRLYEAALASYA